MNEIPIPLRDSGILLGLYPTQLTSNTSSRNPVLLSKDKDSTITKTGDYLVTQGYQEFDKLNDLGSIVCLDSFFNLLSDDLEE